MVIADISVGYVVPCQRQRLWRWQPCLVFMLCCCLFCPRNVAAALHSIDPIAPAVEIYNAAVELSRNNFKQEALDKYVMALDIDPTFAEAHQNVALLFETAGNQERAVYHTIESLKWSRNAIFRGSSLANVVTLLVNWNLFEKNRDLVVMVLGYFEEALTTGNYSDPQRADLLNSVANVYKSVGDHSTALRYYRETLEYASNHTLARFGVGNIYFYRRNFTEASVYYLRCLGVLNPTDVVNTMQILNNLVSAIITVCCSVVLYCR
jgi:tetratricopeptide (TPR) repeat protein